MTTKENNQEIVEVYETFWDPQVEACFKKEFGILASGNSYCFLEDDTPYVA